MYGSQTRQEKHTESFIFYDNVENLGSVVGRYRPTTPYLISSADATLSIPQGLNRLLLLEFLFFCQSLILLFYTYKSMLYCCLYLLELYCCLEDYPLYRNFVKQMALPVEK